jgi:hypothetical protein
MFDNPPTFDSVWLVLFSVTLLYDIVQERQYIFIYYTIWTFTLETLFFVLKALRREREARMLYPYIFAPSIVVCCGFWLIIAPVFLTAGIPTNIVLIAVTHGCNMVAMLQQSYIILNRDFWKPILYTIVYNVFLAIYVGSGGRSISGRRPYWYAKYDEWIGWIFAGLAVAAVGIVHVVFSVQKTRQLQKVFVV